MDIDRPMVDGRVAAPDEVDELTAAECDPGVGCQGGEQLEFPGAEMDDSLSLAQLVGEDIQLEPARLTTDEESSGVIDTEKLLGKGTFLFDAQVHTTKGLPAGTTAGTVGEFVERGQLLALKITDWDAIYAD